MQKKIFSPHSRLAEHEWLLSIMPCKLIYFCVCLCRGFLNRILETVDIFYRLGLFCINQFILRYTKLGGYVLAVFVYLCVTISLLL